MSIFFISFGALFSVTNPLGTLPIFIGLTKDKSKHQITSIALWTSINVMVILIISFLLGNYILEFFGISLNSLKIAGGMIIASSGFALLTGNFTKHKRNEKKRKRRCL
ncbi:MAG: MarC family protein [Crocinitomicaceae bacterium]